MGEGLPEVVSALKEVCLTLPALREVCPNGSVQWPFEKASGLGLMLYCDTVQGPLPFSCDVIGIPCPSDMSDSSTRVDLSAC